MRPSSESSSRTLRRRERRAAEQLLDNSALRDALTDDQANELLEWGFDRLSTAVGRTAYLPDEDATAALEPTITAVSRVMLAVNRLVAHFSDTGDESDTESAIAQLINNLSVVQKLPDQIYDELALVVTKTDGEAVFVQLMHILTSSTETETEIETETETETAVAADPSEEVEDDTNNPELPDTET